MTSSTTPAPASPPSSSTTPAPASPGGGVDVRIVRASALLTFFIALIAGLALLTGRSTLAVILLAVQVIAFSLGIWRLPAQPWSRIARLTGLFRVFPTGPAEHALPVRFSQQVGLLCVLPALIAALAGWSVVAIVFALACAGASALNAFANICLACRVYPTWRLVTGRLGLR